MKKFKYFCNSEPDCSPKDWQAYSNHSGKNQFLVNSETATGGVLSKELFRQISQISQENTCVRVLIKLQIWRTASHKL